MSIVKKVIIFGAGRIAEVVHYYMVNESDVEVAAFTCDKQFLREETFNDLPVVAFEEVQEKFPPDQFDMFIALGYQGLNSVRAERLLQAKNKGYKLTSFVHANSGLPADIEIGENCFIMNNVCIQPRVRLGNNVFVWSGALIGHHSSIGDNCWITSNANISGVVNVGKNCFFAVNATVANNVNIGNECFLGANTLVTKHLKNGQVVIEKSSEVLRLNSEQFLKISRFS